MTSQAQERLSLSCGSGRAKRKVAFELHFGGLWSGKRLGEVASLAGEAAQAKTGGWGYVEVGEHPRCWKGA